MWMYRRPWLLGAAVSLRTGHRLASALLGHDRQPLVVTRAARTSGRVKVAAPPVVLRVNGILCVVVQAKRGVLVIELSMASH
jgi:hypothetical protein